jgi:hypothetical protein
MAFPIAGLFFIRDGQASEDSVIVRTRGMRRLPTFENDVLTFVRVDKTPSKRPFCECG